MRWARVVTVPPKRTPGLMRQSDARPIVRLADMARIAINRSDEMQRPGRTALLESDAGCLVVGA